MQTQDSSTGTSFADVCAATAAATETDPAGGIVLTGRNKAGARARVLAGLVLTTGIVAAIGVLDTTSSAAAGHMM